MDPLEPVEDFPYLDRTIVYNNSDWSAFYHNLRKDRRQRGMILKVLMNMGSMVRECGMMYRVLEQTVILCGSDIWVVKGLMWKMMEGFHHRAARSIA